MTKNQQRILTLIDEAKKGYDLYKNQFELLEAGYQNIIDPRLLKDLERRRKSHIAPKIIKAKVRKVVISVLKTYFENDEFAKLMPEYPTQDALDASEKLQKALNSWTTKRINLYSRFKPVIIDGLVYGTPIVKIYWADGLRINRIKIRDLYIDPNAQSIFDIQYCVNRVVTTVGKLKKQFGRKFKWSRYVGQYDGTSTGVSTVDIGDASRIEVMDVYRYEKGRWLVSTVLPDQSFIRTDEELKDGLPFIIGNIEPQFVGISEPNAVEAFGGSFIEPMIPLQEEYTVTRNQQTDAIDKQLNPQFLSTKTSGLKEADLISNRKKITISQLSEVQQLPVPNINQSQFATDRLDSEMQEVSGITKYNQGINDKANLNQTATGVSILTQEGNSVIEDIIRALNESLFEPAIKRMVTLIYKYDENPHLYGVDRGKSLKFHVSINAGVGAVNSELLLNNIAAAEGSAMQNAKLHFEMQDIEGAKMYLDALDELFKEKLRALRLKTIIPLLEGAIDDTDDTDDGAGGDVCISVAGGTAVADVGGEAIAGMGAIRPGDYGEV
ncbi:portal protein [Hydrogenimonas sp.]